jgi:trigger factor
MATVTRENIGLLNDKITIKVAGADYLPSFEKALKNYSKQANIPGFRKGMVPTGMIKKMHGQSVFADEVIRTVEKSLGDYMQNEKLEIFAQPLPLPTEDAPKLDMNNPTEYVFDFEVGLKPAFSIPDLSKEKMTRYKVTVTEEMINEEVNRLQVRHGKMVDRDAVSEDDNVLNVTFTETDANGNVLEGGVQKDNSFLVKYFAEPVRSTLTGKKKDDVFNIQLNKAFDEKEREWVLSDLGLDKHDEAAAAKFFNVTITKVGLVEKAELNEESFKAIYPKKEIKTEADFRNEIKAEIEGYWEKQTKNHLQHEIYHVLVDHTKIEFPESFLKRWMETGGEQPKSREEVEHEYPNFVNQLKWTLITDQLVQANNVEVKNEDIEAFAKQQLFGYMGMNMQEEEQPWIAEYITRMMKDRKFVEDAYHRIQTEKVFDLIETKVNAIDKPVTVEEFSKEAEKHQHHQH